MKAFILTLLCTLSLSPLVSQVVLNELIIPNTVELKNTGESPVDVSGYVLCQFPNYNVLTILTQVCGDDLVLDPGEILAVNTIFTFDATDGELGLYFNSDDFGDPTNITDYVEWGSTGHERSAVAQAAGIWTEGDFVPSWTNCASLEYDGDGDSSDDWSAQDTPSSPCMENTLDGCGGADCLFSEAGLMDIQCENNDTPADPADDFITFTLNPTGVDLGTGYLVSVSAGAIDPTSGTYGGPTSFTLQPGSAGGGNVMLTLTDNIDTTCTLIVVILDPGACSGDCSMLSVGLAEVGCNDNGTDDNPFDDFISFTLSPTGINLGSGYTVTVTNGSITPSLGEYGMTTSFTLNAGSAGGGDVTIIVRDMDDPDCTLSAVVHDPGECSLTPCDIVSTGLDNITCNDNDTPTDHTDDFITFTLNPAGLDLGASYVVSSSSGAIDPSGAPYGQVTLFTLGEGTAGSGNVFITITDANDANCNVTVLLADPGPCSDLCDLTSAGLTSVNCTDNDTPDDMTDDVITFRLNPAGVNIGETYFVLVSSGNVNPSFGTYGMSTLFSMNPGSAGNGDVTVTVVDAEDPACSIQVMVIDPGPCSISGDCQIITLNLSDSACNDNGTQEDPTDDFITFSLDPEGEDLATTYHVSVSNGAISPASASYGAPTSFMLNAGSAGSGNVFVTVTDAIDPACTQSTLVVDTGPCSMVGCVIADPGLDDVSCNDNDSSDPSDDFIAFSLDPAGVELATTYVVSVSTGSVSPNTGVYGAPASFTLQNGSAGAGNVTLTITDGGDPACTFTVEITDPGACSMGCFIASSGLDSIACDRNDTPDPDDDFITFILDPAGSDLATTYTVHVSSGTVMPASGTYGTSAVFSLNAGSAGGGDVTLTISDGGDTTCLFVVVITDPGACSGCEITDAGLGEILCEDNGTTSDFSDDFITFVLDPTGLDLSDTYIVSAGSGALISPSGAAYGSPVLFSLPPGSAGHGNVEITITDGMDTTCTYTVMVSDPGICSLSPCTVSACVIGTLSETVICVDEGGIPDTVLVTCMSGLPGMESAWLVTDTSGAIMSVSDFNTNGVFVFEGEEAGVCLIWLISWEGTLTGLTPGGDLIGLTGCYDLSNPVTITKLTGTQCESAVFNPALDHLIFVYPVPVSGILHIEAREVQIHRMQIFDPLGRLLLQHQFNTTEVDMHHLEAGLYYLLFETSIGKHVRRIAVSR